MHKKKAYKTMTKQPTPLKLSDLQHRMLKRFGGSSKNLHSFTTGSEQNLKPDLAQRHLDLLRAAGYIRAFNGDSYRITHAGLLALDNYNTQDMVIPVRNSTAKGAYTTPVWSVRAGGDDHLSIRSRGNSV